MLLPSSVSAFDDFFVNRHDTYCVQHADGRYQRVYRRFDSELLARHLLGAETFAVDAVDRQGWSRWLCFDCDAPDGLAQLAAIQTQLAEMALVSLREQSRRGGHLWVLCEHAEPAILLRRLAAGMLKHLRRQGQLTAPIEVYPDTDRPQSTKGVVHPVRLPLGVHQRTNQRYAFVDGADRPCHRLDAEAGLAWLLGQPRNASQRFHVALGILDRLQAPAEETPPVTPITRQATYGVIRWANTELDLAQVMARTHPDIALRTAGKGMIGWCPWHDDAAPQADGAPGTPSLYVVQDRCYGWSWRCLSSNCGAHDSDHMHHTFDWFVWLCAGHLREAVQLVQQWQKAGEP